MFKKVPARSLAGTLSVAASLSLFAVLAASARAEGGDAAPPPVAPPQESYPSPLPAQHATGSSDKPLLRQLPRFTAPGVPEFGPEEEPIGPPVAKNPAPTGLPSGGASQRPMLYVGEGYNKIFLIDHGKTLWTYSTGGGNEYDDAWMLSNGNILFSRMYYVAEITPSKQIVWRYDAPRGTEIHTCQPIGFDEVMFVVNGLPAPRLMMVNIRTKAVLVDHALPAVSSTDPGTIHPQFRRVRVTPQGTYLASFLKMNKVVEYDKNFKEIWSYNIRSPWAAVRLKNGNTLITDEDDILTREVNPKGETVWELTKADIPPQYWYGNTQSVTRLDNGDTIVCSRGGSNQGPQLIEITRDKKVVWVMQDWTHFGPATALQMLDDAGYPERPGDSTH
ncbi:MAG TPA: hypothetical protein VGU23_00210 [Acidobacteriaceae bacterium]|nr:hypothetical protein [Acidobacteriaceae bacterium]